MPDEPTRPPGLPRRARRRWRAWHPRRGPADRVAAGRPAGQSARILRHLRHCRRCRRRLGLDADPFAGRADTLIREARALLAALGRAEPAPAG